jgi:16S rRNA (guanine527-N7)-methyltransferase
MKEENKKILIQCSKSLGVDLSERMIGKFEQYLALLDKWSAVYNLTSVKKERERLIELVIDSLSGAEIISGIGTKLNVIDIGSGAGLPGIPLAIACPGQSFTLCESREKRASFLNEARRTLKLDNVTVENKRAENLAGGEGANSFDVATARAVAPLGDLTKLSRPLLKKDGILLAWKGPGYKEEISDSADAIEKHEMTISDVIDYSHHYQKTERVLVILKKQG